MTKHAGVGMHRQYDPLASTIGLITGFANNADSPTGFQVHMLVRGVERTFDVSETAYSIQFSDDYFPYPPLGERIFMAQFADDGTVVELVDVNDFLAEGNPIKTACMIGTYKMFEYQITEETPRIGEILKVQALASSLSTTTSMPRPAPYGTSPMAAACRLPATVCPSGSLRTSTSIRGTGPRALLPSRDAAGRKRERSDFPPEPSWAAWETSRGTATGPASILLVETKRSATWSSAF